MNLSALRFAPRDPNIVTGHVIPSEAAVRYGPSVKIYVTRHFYVADNVFEYIIFGFFAVFACYIVLVVIYNRHQKTRQRDRTQADFTNV